MATLTTKGFATPRIRFRPGSYSESVELDRELDTLGGPAFVPWGQFAAEFDYDQGEHITCVGTTGSGKTTLARELLIPLREYVVVLGTKNEDDSLYDPLMQQGFILTDRFDPTPKDDEPHRIIFRPPLYDGSDDDIKRQAEAFKKCLMQVFQHGKWCVYADEVRYLSETLGLGKRLHLLWLQGRSLRVSMIAATQRPVSIPLEAFDQATHLFLWRNTDRYNVQRMAEFAGADVALVRDIIPRLPKHEFLYIDTRTGRMSRSKVEL